MKRFVPLFVFLFLAAASAFACNQPGCNQNKMQGDGFVNKVFKALSYIDLKEEDIMDIKLSAKIYRQDMQKIMMAKQFPVEAFGKEELDQKAFLVHCESEQKKTALAKFDFLDAVYSVLSKEQKAQFVKEMESVTNMKKYGMKSGMGVCGNGPGMGAGPNACDGKGPKRGM